MYTAYCIIIIFQNLIFYFLYVVEMGFYCAEFTALPASVPPLPFNYFHDYQTVKVDITMLCNTICFSGCLSTH